MMLMSMKADPIYAKHPVRFVRRRYGNKTFSWPSVQIDGEWHEMDGDPWPAITPKRSEFEPAVERFVTLQKARYFELKDACLPLMESYKDDLIVHDANALALAGPVPYVHYTRDTGTHLFLMLPSDHPNWPAAGETVKYLFSTAGRDHIVKQNRECTEGLARRIKLGDKHTVHHFDGKRLRLVDGDKAHQIVVMHTNHVIETWRKG